MKLSQLILANLVALTLVFSTSVFAQTQVNTVTSEVTTPRADTSNVEPTAQEDMIITNSIKSQLAKSVMLNKYNIDVKTNKGVVTLSGTVDSDSQASLIVETAQSIVGVKDVDANNLNVKDSQQPFTDMMITAKVKGLFIREKVFGDKDIAAVNISVETKNGIVYLTGVVDNQEQIKNAIKLAEGVDGVKRVEYSVKKVTPMPATNGNTDINNPNNNSTQNNQNNY